MKKIYFTVDNEENHQAATSLTGAATFLGYSYDHVRRLLNASSNGILRTRRGIVYETTLSKIEGRGGADRFYKE